MVGEDFYYSLFEINETNINKLPHQRINEIMKDIVILICQYGGSSSLALFSRSLLRRNGLTENDKNKPFIIIMINDSR